MCRSAMPHTTTRKGFFQEVTVSVSASIPAAISLQLLLSQPQSAEAAADITSKLAGTAALRNAKSAQKRLVSDTFSEYIAQGDYPALQAALRAAPVSEIRKSCFVLVRAAADGPLAETVELEYKTFIAALEKLDNVALQATRGRKLGEAEFRGCYEATVAALAAFVATAERSVEIPVSYKDE